MTTEETSLGSETNRQVCYVLSTRGRPTPSAILPTPSHLEQLEHMAQSGAFH
jgi:hypothetical protein